MPHLCWQILPDLTRVSFLDIISFAIRLLITNTGSLLVVAINKYTTNCNFGDVARIQLTRLRNILTLDE